MISDAPLIFIQVCASARVAPGLVVASITRSPRFGIGRGDRRRDMLKPQAGDDLLD
jgi:hypothetical protein